MTSMKGTFHITPSLVNNVRIVDGIQKGILRKLERLEKIKDPIAKHINIVEVIADIVDIGLSLFETSMVSEMERHRKNSDEEEEAAIIKDMSKKGDLLRGSVQDIFDMLRNSIQDPIYTPEHIYGYNMYMDAKKSFEEEVEKQKNTYSSENEPI